MTDGNKSTLVISRDVVFRESEMLTPNSDDISVTKPGKLSHQLQANHHRITEVEP